VKKKILFQGISLSGLSLTLFIFLSVIILFVSSSNDKNLWKDYYTIVVSKSTTPGNLCKAFKKVPGITAIVSEESSMVRFNNLEAMEHISVAHLDERFDQLDPRYDPYMKSLPLYFRCDDGSSVIYVASWLNRLLFFLATADILYSEGTEARFIDFDIYEQLLFPFFVILFSLCFIFIYKKESRHKCTALLGFFPWLGFTLIGDMVSLICFFILYPAWFLFHEELHGSFNNYMLYQWKDVKYGNLIKRVFILGGALFACIVIRLMERSGPESFLLFLPFLGDCSLSAFTLFIFYRRETKREHRIFEPAPIIKLFHRKHLSGNIKKIPSSILLFLVACSFFAYYFVRSGFIPARLPYPLETNNRDIISFQSLENLWKTKKENYLPDLSDYIAHRSYQEGILFGAMYTLPSLNEGIFLSHYRENSDTGRIMQIYRTKQKCDKAWLEGVIGSITSKSLEGLLLSQKRPLHVSSRPVGNYYLCRFPLISSIIIFIVVYLFLFFQDFYLTASQLYGTTNRTGRRSRKAA
jgi:hypothetical protein